MPKPLLPEMTLRAPAVAPPMMLLLELDGPPTDTPTLFPTAANPVASVPRKLPRT